MRKFIVVLILLSVCLVACEDAEHLRPVYNAWMKAHPEVKNLTQEEWTILYRKELLPGQAKSQVDNMGTGLALGFVLGSSGR